VNISTGVPGYLSVHVGQYRNVVVIMVTPAYRTRKCVVIDNAVDRHRDRDRTRYPRWIGRQIARTRARITSDWISLDSTSRKLHSERELMEAEIRDDIIRRCEL